MMQRLLYTVRKYKEGLRMYYTNRPYVCGQTDRLLASATGTYPACYSPPPALSLPCLPVGPSYNVCRPFSSLACPASVPETWLRPQSAR